MSSRAPFLAAAAALLLSACSPPPPPPEPVRAVRTLTVEPQSAGGTAQFAAEARARVESRLGFRVGGRMLAREVEVGQRVRAGQVLARLDPADLRLGQEQSLAAVRAAQSNADLAAADHRRYKELREQGFISAVELDRRETTLRTARAQLEQAQAQAGVQSNQAAYADLRAPAPGVVLAIEAEPGTVLTSGAPVLRMAHDGPRDAVFTVPEDNAERFRALVGRSGALTVRPWGNADLRWPATVREVAAAADPTTRTFQVKADLGPAPAQLGQTLTVELELPRQVGVSRLPLSAIHQQQGRTVVWIVDPASMTVRLQPVQVAGADGNDAIVTAGLSPGQRVVTAGVHALSPGQKVKWFEAAASAAVR